MHILPSNVTHGAHQLILHPPLLQLLDRSSLPGAGSTPLDWWLSQTWPSQPPWHTGDQHGYTWVMQHGGVLAVLGRWPQH